MPRINITQAEVNNHSSLPAMLSNTKSMTNNTEDMSWISAEISQTDLDSIVQSLDADSYSSGVLPKHVIES